MENVCDQLRDAVNRSGKTHYRVAKESGVSQPVLARFMGRQRDIRAATFAKIAAALGLELRPKGEPQKRKDGGK
jgi:transcriptional regulator with XRE-family HTH domain